MAGNSSGKMLAGIAACIVSLTILAGRWGIYRIIDLPELGTVEPFELGPAVFFEVRLWCVVGLCVVTLVGLLAELKNEKNLASKSNGSICVPLSLVALFSWEVLSGFWSLEADLKIYKLYELILMFFMLICVWAWSRSSQANTFCDMFWYSLVATSALLVCASIPQVLSASNAGGTEERLSVLGGGPNVFGRYVDICIVASILSSWRIHFRIPLVGLLLIPLILSGSRGAVLSLFAGCAVCFPVIIGNGKWIRWLIPSIIGVCVLYLIALVVMPGAVDLAAEKFQQRFVETTYYNLYLSDRGELFSLSAEMLAERPVMGHGLSGWGNAWGEPFPHNLFLEVAVEGGFIGLGLLLFFLGSCAFQVFRRFREGRVYWTLIALAAIMLMAAQFSGDLFDSRTVFVSALLCVVPNHRNQSEVDNQE